MGFADEAERAMDIWFGSDMAESITYNGAGIRGHLEQRSDADPGTGAVSQTAVLEIRRADVAIPTYRDTIVAAGITWKVRNIAGGDEWTWKINLYRDENPIWAR